MALDHSPYDQVFFQRKKPITQGPEGTFKSVFTAPAMAPKAFAKSKPCGAGFSRFVNGSKVNGSSGLLFHPGNIPIYIYIYVGYEGHLRIIFPKIPGTSKQHGFFVAREGPWTLGGGSPPSSGNPTCHPHIMEVSKNCHSNAPAEN